MPLGPQLTAAPSSASRTARSILRGADRSHSTRDGSDADSATRRCHLSPAISDRYRTRPAMRIRRRRPQPLARPSPPYCHSSTPIGIAGPASPLCWVTGRAAGPNVPLRAPGGASFPMARIRQSRPGRCRVASLNGGGRIACRSPGSARRHTEERRPPARPPRWVGGLRPAHTSSRTPSQMLPERHRADDLAAWLRESHPRAPGDRMKPSCPEPFATRLRL